MRSGHHVFNSRETLASLTLISLLAADCAVSQAIYPVLCEARMHFNWTQELLLVLRFYLFAHVISQTAVTLYQYRDFFPFISFSLSYSSLQNVLGIEQGQMVPIKSSLPNWISLLLNFTSPMKHRYQTY